MLLLLPLTSFLFLQAQGSDAALAARIQNLLHVVLISGDEKQQAAAEAEAKEIFIRRGLPSTAAIGDEAAYDFVFLVCSSGPTEFQQRVLRTARESAKRHEIPEDAMAFCAARTQQDRAKTEAQKQAPTDPALRDRIEQLYKVDQAVRQKNEFDLAVMSRIDTEHKTALEEIFLKYGVPTYRMVGPEAASDFIIMVQHQSHPFRLKVLPKLKANVKAGQADPGSYAMVLDRSRSETGKKQIYGENLICDTTSPKLRTGPIEDEQQVNQRRAAIGLMRLEIYVQLVTAITPNVCQSAPRTK
jgi:hypothetical protein